MLHHRLAVYSVIGLLLPSGLMVYVGIYELHADWGSAAIDVAQNHRYHLMGLVVLLLAAASGLCAIAGAARWAVRPALRP